MRIMRICNIICFFALWWWEYWAMPAWLLTVDFSVSCTDQFNCKLRDARAEHSHIFVCISSQDTGYSLALPMMWCVWLSIYRAHEKGRQRRCSMHMMKFLSTSAHLFTLNADGNKRVRERKQVLGMNWCGRLFHSSHLCPLSRAVSTS